LLVLPFGLAGLHLAFLVGWEENFGA
jgi:hypothetical protein